MLCRRTPIIRIAGICLALASTVSCAFSQPKPPASPRVPPASSQATTAPDPRNLQAPSFGDRLNLTSPWLFNTGSDNSFASPTHDDTTWQIVDTRNRNSRRLA